MGPTADRRAHDPGRLAGRLASRGSTGRPAGMGGHHESAHRVRGRLARLAGRGLPRAPALSPWRLDRRGGRTPAEGARAERAPGRPAGLALGAAARAVPERPHHHPADRGRSVGGAGPGSRGRRHRRDRAVRGAARVRAGVPRRAEHGGAARDGRADRHRPARRRGDRGPGARAGARRPDPAVRGRPGPGRRPAGRGREPPAGGSAAHRRVGAGGEADRPDAGRRAGGRRPHEHGLRRHRRDLRARPRRRHGDRDGDRVRQDRPDAPGRGDRAARRCRRTSRGWARCWPAPRWPSWP